MEKLVVMDFSDSSITIYENPDKDKHIEDLLYDLGHNIDECSYMLCDKLKLNL